MDAGTLLCIDDRPQLLELRKAALESQGYCVKIASSGCTAMKMLEDTSVAAVVLEYKTEGMDHGSRSLPLITRMDVKLIIVDYLQLVRAEGRDPRERCAHDD